MISFFKTQKLAQPDKCAEEAVLVNCGKNAGFFHLQFIPEIPHQEQKRRIISALG